MGCKRSSYQTRAQSIHLRTRASLNSLLGGAARLRIRGIHVQRRAFKLIYLGGHYGNFSKSLFEQEYGFNLYMAPEVYDHGVQTHKVDVWSLFVTIAWALDFDGFRQNLHHFMSLPQAREAILAMASGSETCEIWQESTIGLPWRKPYNSTESYSTTHSNKAGTQARATVTPRAHASGQISTSPGYAKVSKTTHESVPCP